MEKITIRNLTFTYPRQAEPALKHINLTVNPGEFVTVCGKSGCGKSTLLKHFRSSLAPHGTGTGGVFLGDEEIRTMDQRKQTERIGFVYQSPDNQIVTDKVWHELAFGLESLGCGTAEIRGRVAEMASFFGIQTWFHKKTTELSGGQKQLLNLASVMVMQPQVLILDEPTSQLDPIAAADFLETIKKINRELGTTIILTEHRLEEALPMSDRVIVMDGGSIIAEGEPKLIGKKLKEMGHDMFIAMPAPMRIYAAVENNLECPVTVREGRYWLEEMAGQNKIRKEFLSETTGENKRGIKKSTRDKNEKAFISMNEIWFRYEREGQDIVKGLSADIYKGEFFAIVGGNGTGKSTTLSLLAGLRKPYRGNIMIDGRPVTEALKGEKTGRRIGVLPQNPQSLFVKKTVELDLYEMLSGRKISKEEQQRRVKRVVRLCELQNLLQMHPYDLSGGEQQRAALAKVLLLNPEILLLDEPTKGLDGHFKEKLAHIFKKLKAGGVTLVMVSHDIEFCAEHTDRCAMFFDGQITSIDEPREFFKGKNFYTTASSRMARSILPDAVLPGDIIEACGGICEEKSCGDIDIDEILYDMGAEENKEETVKKDNIYDLHPKDRGKKLTPFRIGISVLAFISLLLTYYFMGEMFTDYRMYLVRLLMVIETGIGLASVFPGNDLELPDHSVQTEAGGRRLDRRTVMAATLILIAIPFTIYFGIFYLENRKYYFISLMVILECMLPFVVSFENKKPQARELMVIAVLCAIAVAGRAAFFMLPQFKPVIAIVIISGVCFGGEAGFLVGAVTAFVSNMFFGQSPLTPWQMFAYGMAGLIAGIFFRKGLLRKTKGSLCIFGGLVTFFVCGFLLDTGSGLTWLREPSIEAMIPYYMTGVVFNLIHAFATIFFLWFAAEPFIEKLDRIKIKYGLINN
ncbi:MAG: energy-coupling factor transporter ATPase [Anaerovoracaceae bacterium]